MKKLLVALLLSGVSLASDPCLDAVKIAIRAASTMNDEWHRVCLTSANTQPREVALCDYTYETYKKVFDKHR